MKREPCVHGSVGLAVGDDVEDHLIRAKRVLDEGGGDDGGSEDVVGCKDEVEEGVVNKEGDSLRGGEREAGGGVVGVLVGQPESQAVELLGDAAGCYMAVEVLLNFS